MFISPAPLTRLTASSLCDRVALGCHAIPPTRSVWPTRKDWSVEAAGSVKSGYRAKYELVCTTEHSKASQIQTSSMLRVFDYWERIEPVRRDGRLQSASLRSRNAANIAMLLSSGDAQVGDLPTFTSANVFFRISMILPRGIRLSTRCCAMRF
jgi:hypothetical protein